MSCSWRDEPADNWLASTVTEVNPNLCDMKLAAAQGAAGVLEVHFSTCPSGAGCTMKNLCLSKAHSQAKVPVDGAQSQLLVNNVFLCLCNSLSSYLFSIFRALRAEWKVHEVLLTLL